ncbi:MAG TPA: hypothetical protein VMH31_08930 [Methylomirabilota bacterium]|nr:hypothetical protein [Methylomirabilota bacterium]
MSTTPRAITTDADTVFARAKNAVGSVFFLAAQHSPRLLALHRNERAWSLLRFLMGCTGAALVILPLSLWSGYLTALFGLAMFVVSILLPPAELESATDRKAKELGAQTVVSGGEIDGGNAGLLSVQLFVSPAQTWALDKNLEPLVTIATGEITDLTVKPVADHWSLVVRWGEHHAEFVYRGIFAERFARLAEESLRQASLAAAPAKKHRAANA